MSAVVFFPNIPSLEGPMRFAQLIMFALVTSFASSCASSSGTSASARPATQAVGLGTGSGTVVISNTAAADVQKFAHPAERVWRALPAAFDSLAIPVNTIEPSIREMGNTALKIRSRLGKAYLSRYLDCGNTQIGPNADSYDVVLTVLSRVTADGTGSTLATSVQAQARPATYNQPYNKCSSKGTIEKRMIELVTSAVSTSPAR